ncbi:MAG: T9SS type A sorting domain-containing protein [Schleiferiaceae bacterium]|nr:T9SS type A sorting domain-containing protein [Schleiferiaceae bacterium]
MRRVLLLLVFFCSLSLSASHLITGHFSFEHLSTGTTTSVYTVKLVLYRDVTGVAMPNSVTVYYEALGPNGVTSSVSLGQASNGALTGNCGSTYGIEAYTYSANLTVNNNTGYTFAYSTCCRPSAITNIANASSQSIYLSGVLVTGKPSVRSYNNSPEIVPGIATAYANTSYPFEICSADPEGDSLSFQIVTVKSGSAATFSPTNIAYSTGYSNAAPLGSGSSVAIDTANRMLVIQSNTLQNAVVTVKITEWAQDTTNTFKIMGFTEREILVNIVSSASAPPQSLIEATSASATFGESDIYLTTSDAVFPTSANFDSVQVQLFDAYGNTTNYVTGSSALTSSYDSFKLHTSDSIMPGPWTLIFGYSADSSAITGLCDSKLMDTLSFFVAPPSPILVGPSDSIYAPTNPTYTLTNYQYADSVAYALSNASLISSAPDFSSFEVQWGPANGAASFAVYAYNGGIADTAAIDVTIYGIGIDELDGSVVLYPNPTEEFVYLKGVPAGTLFELRSITGELVLTGNAENRIDLRSIPSGVLMLTLRHENERRTYKLIKQ